MSTTVDDATTASTTTRSWSEFFSTAEISMPVSFSDASTRVTQNLRYFFPNYAHLALTIFFVSLYYHLLSLLILFLIALAWNFLFFARRDDPIEVFGFTIGDRIVSIVLGVITVVALIYANVWVNLLVSIGVSAVVVVLHAVFRVSGFGDDNPYGGLLDSQSGGYSEF